MYIVVNLSLSMAIHNHTGQCKSLYYVLDIADDCMWALNLENNFLSFSIHRYMGVFLYSKKNEGSDLDRRLSFGTIFIFGVLVLAQLFSSTLFSGPKMLFEKYYTFFYLFLR